MRVRLLWPSSPFLPTLFAALLVLWLASLLRAQETKSEAEPGEPNDPWEDHLETDRDSFTPAITTVGAGRMMLESAYSFTDARVGFESHSFPEMLVRYGANDWLEWRLGWNFETGGGASVSSVNEGQVEDASLIEREVEHRIGYGAKAQLFTQEGLLPDAVVILQGYTPTGGSGNDSHVVGTYGVGWEGPRGSRLDASLRYRTASEEEDRFAVWAPSAVFKIPLGRRWAVHAEYFGVFSHQKEDEFSRNYFSPGIHHLVTPDFEVGLRVGWGLTDDSGKFFSNFGIGWRF